MANSILEHKFTARWQVQSRYPLISFFCRKLTANLNDIFYSTNSADLTEDSKWVIDEFVEYLKDNPDLKIEIRGHTDNVGDEGYNKSLSTDREFTVREFIQEKGIDGSRLSHKGFGSSMPVASNENEDGRAKNRRTEFVIISK